MGNQMDKVINGLYVGGFLGANQKKKMHDANITHVLAVHDTAEAHWPEDFTYKCIKIADTSSANLSIYFSECIDFVHESRLKGGVVFIHCAAGISRSVTITVAYLMTVSTLSFDDTLKVVQYCREMANPNYGFRMQLQRYQEEKLLLERKRILSQFPETPSLQDEEALQELLVKASDPKAKEKSSIEERYKVVES